MRARLIIEKFTEHSDPLKDMGIGNPEKMLFPTLKNALKRFGIVLEWHKDHNMGEGFWYFTVDFGILDDDRLDSEIDVQLSYATDKAIEESEEDWESGFGMTNDDGDEELIPYTHDVNVVIKALVKRKYGSKKDLDKQIVKLQSQIQKLQNIIGVYES